VICVNVGKKMLRKSAPIGHACKSRVFAQLPKRSLDVGGKYLPGSRQGRPLSATVTVTQSGLSKKHVVLTDRLAFIDRRKLSARGHA
jgi:hypothetical protein